MSTLDRLSPEQRQVVETWGQGLAVLAGAGSGKTTTLVVKCQELLRRKPDARIAAVSFTEKSASDLREKLSRRLPGPQPLKGHWVATIHGLCSSVIREFPREAGFDGEESMMSESDSQLVWERALNALWFEELPDTVGPALECLLEREGRSGVEGLLRRTRELRLFGLLDRLKDSPEPTSRALVTLSEFVFGRYDRFKRRRGSLDFNDLEQGADRALGHAHVREALQKRFDLVLVDEFQDTNPLQAGILWRVARPGGTNLCVVGDPKQSIYRFRDADVSVFEELCSQLPQRISLTWNFRSRPGIIDFSNRVCAPAFEVSKLTYEPLVPKREVHPEGLPPVERLEVSDPIELARAIRGEVERGIPLEQMALVLRKIRGNEHWLKALQAEGIPLAVGSGGLFWEDPRVRELSALIQWWDQPGNALSGAVFLRAPWVAVPDAELDAWVRQDPTLQAPFFASSHPVARLLGSLRGRTLRPAELILRLLDEPGIEAELGAQALGLWHRLEEWSSRGMEFHAVALELQDCLAQGRRERDVPPPKNRGQLLVLTIHGSKGLEFDHVILVDLPPKVPRPGETPLLFWDRSRGAFLGRRTPEGDRDRKDAEELLWREDEKAKALAESKRLFYVALTRARERLWLVYPPTVGEGAELGPEVLDKDFWRGWIETSGSAPAALLQAPQARGASPGGQALPATAEAGGPGALTPADVGQVELFRPRYSVTEWNLLGRCARAYEWTSVRPKLLPPQLASRRSASAQPAGLAPDTEVSHQELGTQVHRCLELGDWDGLRGLEQSVGPDRLRAQPLIEWGQSHPLMAPADRSLGRRVWTEFSFEVPVGGESLVGSIDRLVQDGDRFTLVDFKVTRKAKPAAELIEAYRNQLALYARAVKILAPESQGNLDILLVNITPGAVQCVPVEVSDSAIPDELARQAARIVSGHAGVPSPGSLCGVCDFRSSCPEAARA